MVLEILAIVIREIKGIKIGMKEVKSSFIGMKEVKSPFSKDDMILYVKNLYKKKKKDPNNYLQQERNQKNCRI